MAHSRYIALMRASGDSAPGTARNGDSMEAAAGHRISRRLIGQFFRTGQVTDVRPVAARMRRITLAVPGLAWVPGQQVRVCVGNIAAPASWLDGLRRTYSVWDYDGALLQLCVLDHGDGPGARWARSVQAGDEVLLSPPEGALVIRPAAHHLLVGEETAAVAFGPLLRALGEQPWRAVVEVDARGDRLPLPDEVSWHYRAGAPAASSAALVAAVRELDLPAEPGSAYIAGEARTVQAIGQHLIRERGWPRRAIRAKPFWTPGKTGLD
jgi:NADPH-dependent ferric siderophore reductase